MATRVPSRLSSTVSLSWMLMITHLSRFVNKTHLVTNARDIADHVRSLCRLWDVMLFALHNSANRQSNTSDCPHPRSFVCSVLIRSQPRFSLLVCIGDFCRTVEQRAHGIYLWLSLFISSSFSRCSTGAITDITVVLQCNKRYASKTLWCQCLCRMRFDLACLLQSP